MGSTDHDHFIENLGAEEYGYVRPDQLEAHAQRLGDYAVSGEACWEKVVETYGQSTHRPEQGSITLLPLNGNRFSGNYGAVVPAELTAPDTADDTKRLNIDTLRAIIKSEGLSRLDGPTSDLLYDYLDDLQAGRLVRKRETLYADFPVANIGSPSLGYLSKAQLAEWAKSYEQELDADCALTAVRSMAWKGIQPLTDASIAPAYVTLLNDAAEVDEIVQRSPLAPVHPNIKPAELIATDDQGDYLFNLDTVEQLLKLGKFDHTTDAATVPLLEAVIAQRRDWFHLPAEP